MTQSEPPEEPASQGPARQGPASRGQAEQGQAEQGQAEQGQPEPEPQGTPPAAHWPTPGRRSPDPWLAWLRKVEHQVVGTAPELPVPAWMRPTRGEPRWPVTLTVLAAIVLQILLPQHLTSVLPRWLMPTLEGALLIGLTIADPIRVERGGTAMRAASIFLILLITGANAVSAVLLIRAILEGKAGGSAGPLLSTGAAVWLTNVIAFGLWYWEFDRGGPVRRAAATRRHPDLMFPQMASPELAPPDWEPQFVDYLYLSFTNATAFSPTDVMPLARWAKLTMLVQSAVSLAIGALVIARAVNILKT